MLELIDKRARHVFLYAEALARQEDGDCVGAEELFGGLLHQSLAERSDSSALRVLDKVGVPGRAALLVFLALRGRRVIQPLTLQDSEALLSRGIDLDSLASGSWAAPAPAVAPKVRRKTWWHKPQPVREPEAEAGPRRLPFTETAKSSLELMRLEALRLGDEFLGTEHLLLGIVRSGGWTVTKVLDQFGVDLDQLRAAVEGSPRRPDQMTSPLWSFERAADGDGNNGPPSGGGPLS